MIPSSTPEQLEQAFRATEAGGGAGQGAIRRRLLPESSLDVFTEVRFPSRDWALVVRSSELLEDRDLVLTTGLTCRTSSGCVEIVAGPQTERQLFCILLADLVSQLSSPGNAPVAALARRLAAWQRMLSRGLPTGLTPEVRLGLFGELLVLRDVMLPAIGTDAVRAWVGPSSAPQDFAHLSTFVEVKTVSRREPGRCRISDERQLDSTGTEALFLVHQVVSSVAEGAALGELVDELRGDPLVQADLAWFDNSLLEIGWLDAHRSRYDQDRYSLTRRRCFSVAEGFPRIIPSALPLGVSDVSYILDLSACHSFQLNEEAVRDSVAGTGAMAEE